MARRGGYGGRSLGNRGTKRIRSGGRSPQSSNTTGRKGARSSLAPRRAIGTKQFWG